MRTGKLSLENIITGMFIMLMSSAFLLCAQEYTTISDGKYHMFMIVCGGYCAIIFFVAFQRFALGSAGAAQHGACREDRPKDAAALPAEGAADVAASVVGGYAMHRYNHIGAVTRTTVIIYIILTFISARCSDYFPETILGSERHEGTLTIAIYGLTFIFVSRHYRPHLLHAAIFGASVIVFDVISLLQVVGLDPFGLYPDGLSWADRNVKYSGEFIGTIGNADLVSAFLCIAIPLTAVVGGHLVFGSSVEGSGTLPVSIVEEDGEIKKKINNKLIILTGILCLIAAALSLALLAVIKVTAGLLAMAFVCLIAAPIAAYIFSDAKKRKIIAVYLAVLVLAGCAAGAFIYVETSLPGTAGELHEIMHGNIDDSFGTSRVYIYRNVMERVPSHLLIGTGPDTIGRMDIEPFQRYDAERGVMVTARIDTAHNEFLNVLACQGILALGAYLAFALGVTAAALLGMVNCAAAPTSTALALSASAYLIQSMFSFSSCTTAPYFWITCATLIATLSSNRSNI